MENNELDYTYDVLEESGLDIDMGMVQEEVQQTESANTSSLLDLDNSIVPLADSNGNYYPWEYYQVIHDATATVVREELQEDISTINDNLDSLNSTCISLVVCLVLGGVVCFVKGLLSPS